MTRGKASIRRSWTVLAAAIVVAGGLALILLNPGAGDGEVPSGFDARPVLEGAPEDPVLQGRAEPGAPEPALRRGRGVVTGLIIDGGGRPLSGIAVRAREEREPYRRDLLALPTPTDAARGLDPGVAGRSGADGRFCLTGLAVDVRTWIEAEVEAPLCTARALSVPKADARRPPTSCSWSKRASPSAAASSMPTARASRR